MYVPGTVGGKQSEDKGSYTSKSSAARIPWTFLLNIVSVLAILTLKAMALFPSWYCSAGIH